jgi:hypothetical protein
VAKLHFVAIEIYDLNSKLVMSKNVEDEISTFDVKSLSAGLYVVILRNGNTFEYQNFVKQ